MMCLIPLFRCVFIIVPVAIYWLLLGGVVGGGGDEVEVVCVLEGKK